MVLFCFWGVVGDDSGDGFGEILAREVGVAFLVGRGARARERVHWCFRACWLASVGWG